MRNLNPFAGDSSTSPRLFCTRSPMRECRPIWDSAGSLAFLLAEPPVAAMAPTHVGHLRASTHRAVRHGQLMAGPPDLQGQVVAAGGQVGDVVRVPGYPRHLLPKVPQEDGIAVPAPEHLARTAGPQGILPVLKLQTLGCSLAVMVNGARSAWALGDGAVCVQPRDAWVRRCCCCCCCLVQQGAHKLRTAASRFHCSAGLVELSRALRCINNRPCSHGMCRCHA